MSSDRSMRSPVLILLFGALLTAGACETVPTPSANEHMSSASTQEQSVEFASPGGISRTRSGSPIIVNLRGEVVGSIPNLPPHAAELAVSPDGRTIAFSTALGFESRIFTIEIDGSHLTKLTKEPPPAPPGEMQSGVRATGPSWSPDGSRIVFYGFGDLRTIGPDGTGLRVLGSCCLPYGIMIAHPKWSPDGARILFSSVDGMRTISLTGDQNRLPSPAGPSFDGDWSPDGVMIAFSHADGQSTTMPELVYPFDIWVMEEDGEHARPLVVSPDAIEIGPFWSPDGAFIAYTRIAGKREVWVVEVASGQAHRVTEGTMLDWLSSSELIVGTS